MHQPMQGARAQVEKKPEVIRVVTKRRCPLWVPNAKLDLHAVGDRCMWCEGTKFVVEYHEVKPC